jgi:hypothetical protein
LDAPISLYPIYVRGGGVRRNRRTSMPRWPPRYPCKIRREASRFRGGQPGVYVFSPVYLDYVFWWEERLCRVVREGLEGELDEVAKLSTRIEERSARSF